MFSILTVLVKTLIETLVKTLSNGKFRADYNGVQVENQEREVNLIAINTSR
jgi:hypothetical protein